MSERRALAELARLWGIQLGYRDVAGRTVRADPEAVLATLAALGAPVAGMEDVPAALAERRADLGRRVIEPVTVAWDGRLVVRLTEGSIEPVEVEVETEDGEARSWRLEGGGHGIRIPDRLPFGYHTVHVRHARRRGTAHVISSPRRGPGAARGWGIFVPLYALHSAASWGVGDLGDLGELARWAGGLGASVVATTPLHAAFLDEPFEPGPYSPVSRLFWNELFLDLGAIPEVAAVTGDASEVRRAAVAPGSGSLVDHRRAMAVKRRVLEAAVDRFLSGSSGRRDAFDEYVRQHETLRRYALFRAAVERHRTDWRSWPTRQREGRLRPGDVDRRAYRYHLFVQWLLELRTAEVREDAARRGVALGLDLPLGCHPGGFDIWRERPSFAMGASTGAPPDAFFSGGQDWGLPPPHPDGIRLDSYAYLRRSLRHVLSRAGVLRVDHIMGFHRLFWIPAGLGPRRGVYVRYRPEEMYAVLVLEAHRAGAAVVGEDLGTVPAEVRAAMDRHGIGRSYVLQTELGDEGGLPPPPRGSMAMLNTHDMPTFATFRRGGDIDLRLERGWLDRADAPEERHRRAMALRLLERAVRHNGDLASITTATLSALASSDAALGLVGMEDLWGESRPQNVPGTTDGSNWRRRARYPLERIARMRRVATALRSVDRARRGVRGR